MTSILGCIPLQAIGEFIDSLDNKLHEMDSGVEKQKLSLLVGSVGEASNMSVWESTMSSSVEGSLQVNVQKSKESGSFDSSDSSQIAPKSSSNPGMEDSANNVRVIRESSLGEEFSLEKKNIVPFDDSKKEEFDFLSYY